MDEMNTSAALDMVSNAGGESLANNPLLATHRAVGVLVYLLRNTYT